MLQQKIQYKPYVEKDFTHLKGLTGISDKTLEIHLGLYSGYVKNTNALNEKIVELTEAGKTGQPEYNEIKRRYGWEYNGMRLHEYYFGNMKTGGSELKESSNVGRLMTDVYSSLDVWKNDFTKVGAMRGVGWAPYWDLLGWSFVSSPRPECHGWSSALDLAPSLRPF